ncbi:MAG TPA: 1-deoxy-D-xylulose-5-phosphate reductoisomerase, partial [Rectinemataceae bacterium]|nr:1-deoxy-D-xylulose-5-phosphate reductoisomerase [Rectinemataceae bacterium]
MAKRVIVVGATGSIGRQTLDVLGAHPELFSVVALCSHTDEAGLLLAASRFPGASLALSGAEAGDPRIAHSGAAALERLLGEMQADIVVNGASGAAGLRISVAALEGGKDLALANKESVVMGWSVLRQAAAGSGRLIVPVDSEHAAL